MAQANKRIRAEATELAKAAEILVGYTGKLEAQLRAYRTVTALMLLGYIVGAVAMGIFALFA